MDKTFAGTFMLNDKEEVIEALWSQALATKFMRIPEEERNDRARIYDLDEDIILE